jgi:hypothetical protein
MSVAFASDNISEVDKFIVSESLGLTDLPEFEFNNSEEIRAILNRFLKSSNLIIYLEIPTELFSAFIKEVCAEYSELLFFSYKAISEIRDLEIIKNALNERYKRYFKLATNYEKEINELKNRTIPNMMINTENTETYPLLKSDSMLSIHQLKEQINVK